MTAAEYQTLSVELADATLRVEGVTEQVRLRGLTFDPDAPLPDLHLPVRGLGIETVEEVEDDE